PPSAPPSSRSPPAACRSPATSNRPRSHTSSSVSLKQMEKFLLLMKPFQIIEDFSTSWCCMAWLSSRLTETTIVRSTYRIQFSVYFLRIVYLVSLVQTCSISTYLFLDLPFKQFWALSDQFYRTPEHRRFVRQQVVNQGFGGDADGRREVHGLGGVVDADVRRGEAAACHLPLAPQHTGCGARVRWLPPSAGGVARGRHRPGPA
uniref:Uncharacterized protein n=2 Tax=Aegilops tauschii subsp. strangulata TaxID=200361 RepID=A0A453PS25_AEGTS